MKEWHKTVILVLLLLAGVAFILVTRAQYSLR